ncbi:hypothetical protein ETU08_07705 [Apibacter muscae]|uniref:hypothetical protein n=1 Tax=Apibacter muscae TaxID=2509004 RepID=UPI0011ADB081|nr:hypothetical protein [Apibacter muscae]TWP29165.1 hypothetical protein ETU08_07705 [Apibacter muscae]
MNWVYFLFLFNIIFISAQEGIENILKSQLEDGNSVPLGDEYESHEYSEKDLDATIPIIENILKTQGYKTLTSSEFKEKIKSKFNRIIDEKSEKRYLYVDLYDKCSRDIIYTRNPIYNGFFIIKNKNFITSLYAIPELIDYQKEYPEIAKVENKILIKTDSYWTDNLEVPHWRDTKNLSSQRRFIKKLLIARNKYLFNEDQNQFAWLITNDAQFMRSLVTTFGYTEDKKLYKWFFDNTPFDEKNLDEFGELIWTKYCNNSISIHNNFFNVIDNLLSVDKEKYLNYLLKYLQYVLDYDVKNPNALIKQISLAQKCELIGRIISFGEKFRYAENINIEDPYKFMGWTFMMDYKELYKKEFERNNYYNLPEFKERYKMAEDYWVSEVLPFNE